MQFDNHRCRPSVVVVVVGDGGGESWVTVTSDVSRFPSLRCWDAEKGHNKYYLLCLVIKGIVAQWTNSLRIQCQVVRGSILKGVIFFSILVSKVDCLESYRNPTIICSESNGIGVLPTRNLLRPERNPSGQSIRVDPSRMGRNGSEYGRNMVGIRV